MLWYRCVARGSSTTVQARRSLTRYPPHRYVTTARRQEGFTSFFAARPATSPGPASVQPPTSSACHLVLQLLELTNLVDLQAGELLLPAIERLFADPYPPDQLGHRHPHFRLLHDGHNLLH